MPATNSLTCVYMALSIYYRYVTRSSSGNWLQDRLTLPEKLAYQKAMGYKIANPARLAAGATTAEAASAR